MTGRLVEAGVGGRLYVEEHGPTDGRPVLLLHSGLLDSRMWDAQVGPLADAGYRAIRYDLRGFGRSDRPDRPYSHVDDALAVLDGAGVARAAVVGSSFGGAIALWEAVLHPERVSSLVLAASGVSGYSGWSPRMRAHWDDVDSAVRAGDLDGAHALDLAPWVLDLGEPSDASIRAIAAENRHTLTFDESLELGPDEPMEPRLPEIAQPALVTVGDRDIPEMQAIAQLLVEQLTNSRGPVVIEGADHLLPMRRPAAFNQAMLEFLDGVSRA